MAGRGGRGRGGKGRGFTFDIGAIGFGRGEALPTAIQQPPPLFPPQEKKPLPLRASRADDYLLNLKQEFKTFMQESAYFLKPDISTKDIDRYSDRYREKPHDEPTIEWEPDWRLFPSELKIRVKKRRSHLHASRTVIPQISGRRTSEDITSRLEQLEQSAGKEEEKEKVGEQGDSGEEEEEEYDEEEQEEDNDYLVSHFDDDDAYGGGDDDDMDEGPTY